LVLNLKFSRARDRENINMNCNGIYFMICIETNAFRIVYIA